MDKQVIVITGTPCVGKTKVATELAKKLDAWYVNLTDTAKKYDLTLGEDKERHTTIINENRMKNKIVEIINSTQKDHVIIDGHYAPAIVPKNKVTRTFVLRRNPIQLQEFMVKRGFKDQKLWENLASEILDVCLVEALNNQDQKKICELDVTDKTVEEIIKEILAILNNHKTCHTGGIDWLGILEREGKLDEYLRI